MCTCIFFLDLSFPIHAMGTKKTPSRGCRNKRGAVCVVLGREPGTQQGFRALPGSGRACSGSEPARAHPSPPGPAEGTQAQLPQSVPHLRLSQRPSLRSCSRYNPQAQLHRECDLCSVACSLPSPSGQLGQRANVSPCWGVPSPAPSQSPRSRFVSLW